MRSSPASRDIVSESLTHHTSERRRPPPTSSKRIRFLDHSEQVRPDGLPVLTAVLFDFVRKGHGPAPSGFLGAFAGDFGAFTLRLGMLAPRRLAVEPRAAWRLASVWTCPILSSPKGRPTGTAARERVSSHAEGAVLSPGVSTPFATAPATRPDLSG